jgi:hypothetical protein
MADCEISSPLSETADVEIQDHADQSAEKFPEKRQSVEDMLALKKVELAGLLQEDVSKMNLHQANAHKTKISATECAISGYETEIKNRKIGKLVKESLSTSGDVDEQPTKKPRTVWTDDDVERLVHARTKHNEIFQEHHNNMRQKWDIVTAAYNDGFVSPVEGRQFPALDTELHRPKNTVKHKFEDILAEFRNIVRLEDPQNQAAQIQRLQHADIADVEADILAELEMKKGKFRFYNIMVKCGWRERAGSRAAAAAGSGAAAGRTAAAAAAAGSGAAAGRTAAAAAMDF